MPSAPKILAFSGSNRDGSYNRMLLEAAAAGVEAAGGEVKILDLRKLRLPLYDGDLERIEGLPDSVRELKAQMIAHQGFLIASPEYNGSISPALKNALDWASRPAAGEAALACFANKVAAICSASPGGLGGLRGLVHVRAILNNLKVLVLPDQVAVGEAQHAFQGNGAIKNEQERQVVEALGAKLVDVTTKLSA